MTNPASDPIDDLAERLYGWSGGIFWRGETTWQDRHRDEARQWFAYAELLTGVTSPKCSCGNDFGGDNFCMPSACQWEGIDDSRVLPPAEGREQVTRDA